MLTLRFSVVVMMLPLIVASCRPANDAAEHVISECPTAGSNAGEWTQEDVSLFACVIRGRYSAETVPIFVGIRNVGDEPVLVDARFDLFGDLGVWVVGPDGVERQPRNFWEPGDVREELVPYFQYVLPRGGIMGRSIDLACGVEDYTTVQCLELFLFDQAGDYIVRVEHGNIRVCSSVPCTPETMRRMELRADSITLHIAHD